MDVKNVTVCWHGWRATPDGGQEHCEMDDSPDGYCVYTRHDFDASLWHFEPFDLVDERDFETEAEAEAEAYRRADILGCAANSY